MMLAVSGPVSVAYHLSKWGDTEIMFHLREYSEKHDFRHTCFVSIILKKTARKCV